MGGHQSWDTGALGKEELDLGYSERGLFIGYRTLNQHMGDEQSATHFLFGNIVYMRKIEICLWQLFQTENLSSVSEQG